MPKPSPSLADQPPPAGDARARRSVAQWLADVLLFFASPFISIAYAAALPIVGLMRMRTGSADAKPTSGERRP